MTLPTHLGLRRLVRVLPEWLLRRRYLFIERSLDDLPTPRRSDLVHERWGRARLPEIAAVNPAVDLEELLRRDDAGDVCQVTLDSGRIVHYRWITTAPRPMPFLRLDWRPLPGDYMMFDVFTPPDARGRGVATDSFLAELWRCRADGLKRALAVVAWWNLPSLRPSYNLGFTAPGTVTLWVFGVTTRHTVTGRARLEPGRRLSLAPPAPVN